MIRAETIFAGDYVEAEINIFDYAVPGTVFKIIDRSIPGQPTSAIGWLIDAKTGAISGSQAYPLPHDKISHMPRRKLARIIEQQLVPLNRQKKDLDRSIELIEARVRNIENTSSREEEEVTFLRSFLSFV